MRVDLEVVGDTFMEDNIPYARILDRLGRVVTDTIAPAMTYAAHFDLPPLVRVIIFKVIKGVKTDFFSN